jgi:ATP-binding cassette, subfamily C, bacteriocin exporter
MDCGAAALASICAYYKLQIPIARVRQYAKTDQKGTNLLGLVEAGKKLGFTAKGVKLTAEGDLKDFHLPAIAHVLSQGKFPHYLVIYRVTNKYVRIMDPEYGEMKKMRLEELRKMMTGYLVLLSPDTEFKTGQVGVSKRKQFLSLLKPNAYNLTQIIFGSLIYTVLGMGTAIYIEKVTDFVIPNYNGNLMSLLSVSMLLLIVVQLVIGVFRMILNIRVGQIIDIKMILGYYKHLTRMPQSFFDNMRVGEIMSRINDAVKIRSFINEVAVSFFVNTCIVIFSFVLMAIYNWKFALIIMISIPFYFTLYLLSNNLNKRTAREVMEKSADLQSQLIESINGMETIKLFNLEEHANLVTEERFIDLLRSMYKVSVYNMGIFFSSDAFAKIFTIILFWSGTYFIFKNELTPGELFSFYALIGYFTGPIEALVGANRPIQEAVIAADRLFEILDLEGEESGDIQRLELQPHLLGNIRFENIVFRYGSRAKVFNDISFSIEHNKVTAIVGVSGSGKSTLVSLIQKMYPLTSGKIFIGGYDMEYISTRSLRSFISVVPQNIVLFAGTVIQNISVGDPSPNMERIFMICRELDMIPFITALPNGFETYIGENGATLSGGQRQRIGIARALYKDFEFFVMDEATSSLDTFSDAAVQRVIRRLKDAGKTVIIITHRLSSIIHADKIIVLKEGQIIEEGGHTELIERKDYYSSLWKTQF